MPEEKHPPQVFISYSRKDLAFVEQLAADFKANGLDVWYDLSGLEGGQRWRIEIEKAIQESQYVIIVLSPDSVASEWVEREYLYANNRKKKIVPLFYKACDLPMYYLNVHFIDVQGSNYKRNYKEILLTLGVKSIVLEKLPPVSGKKESNTEKSKENQGVLMPAKAPFKERLGAKSISILVALGSLTLILVFGLPSMIPEPENTPEPTRTVTIQPSSTATEVFTPTALPFYISTAYPGPLPTEITDDFDVEMALVPAGEFTMGSAASEAVLNCQKYQGACERDWFIAEEPSHQVYVDAFYMDKFEVTNALYKDCVSKGECKEPFQRALFSFSDYYGNVQYNDYPIVYVTWDMARTYCEWRSARLPSEAEWEKAARGTDGRTYPWGEELDCEKANYGGCEGNLTKVGSYEGGKSPYGLYDMVGNVMEWVEDWYQVYPGGDSNASTSFGEVNRVLRGGSWINVEREIQTYHRYRTTPQSINNFRGFRCAKDVAP